jgi:hypothetical protein
MPSLLPEVTDTEEEDKKDSQTEPSSVVPPVIPVSSETIIHQPVVQEVAAVTAFEPPVPLHEVSGHGHHGAHGHHPHAHHPHHHGHHHGAPPTHIEVPQEKLQPAQEGAEMSYHDNLVPTDQNPDKDEEF